MLHVKYNGHPTGRRIDGVKTDLFITVRVEVSHCKPGLRADFNVVWTAVGRTYFPLLQK